MQDGVIDATVANGLLDVFMSNLDVILPVGITLLGISLGVGMIPRIVYKFF